MLKYLLIAILILLAGCSKTVYVYHNTTINNTQIYMEEVLIPACPDCNCNYQDKQECPGSIKTVVVDSCTQKLNLCNIRLDEMNDHLYSCLLNNNTEHYEDLKYNYTKTVSERDDCLDELQQIKDLVN